MATETTTLAPRELEVLRGIASGKTNQQIALDMRVGYETVRTYVKRLFRKIQVRNRVDLAVYAVENNLFGKRAA